MPAEIVIVADIWVRPEHEERVLELLRDDIEHTHATFRNAGLRVAGTELISNESAEVTGELKAGRYTFFCTPHESAGMTGTLTVR